MVGQAEERVSLLLELAMLTLAAGQPAEGARFIVLDATGVAKKLATKLPHDVKVVAPCPLARLTPACWKKVGSSIMSRMVCWRAVSDES